MTDEQKKHVSDGHLGVSIAPETRQKISEARLGHVVTPEARQKISDGLRGKSSGMKDKHQTPEARQKISMAKKGKSSEMPVSEEARQKMSVAATVRLIAGAFRKKDGFRSGWEKKVSEWMTAQQWDWRYEEKSYVVSGHQYTPDFHVYQNGVLLKIVEVKGHWWRDARQKLEQFMEQYPDLPFEVWDIQRLTQLGVLP
jgi:hypothetical protein